MGLGPITIFDKSALQALSLDEAVWFDTFFLANVVPVFYVETLADLEKDVTGGREPEALVGMLAEKTPSGAHPNVHHRDLTRANLLGQEILMTGQVIVGAGETRRAPDGSVGMHVDEFPEEASLQRWQNHEFLELERATAKHWRADLAANDTERMVDIAKNVLPPGERFSSLEQLKEFIDGFCSTSDPAVLELTLVFLDVPDGYRHAIRRLWNAEGCPRLETFAPYAMHVFTVDLLYYLGIHRGFIGGERASNKADMAYLYYLPFAMVFVSGDKLHHRTAPLFLREDQTYVRAAALKSALHEIDEHYDALPDIIKERGVMAFAHYPPSHMDNVVTTLWDKHMRPDWRDEARRAEARMENPRDDPAGGVENAQELRSRIEQARPVPDGTPGLSGSDHDYAVIRRMVPIRKGKWRMLPKDVEEAGDAN